MKESEGELERSFGGHSDARDYFRMRAIEEVNVMGYSAASHVVKELQRDVVQRRYRWDAFLQFTAWAVPKKYIWEAPPLPTQRIQMPPITIVTSLFDTPELRVILEQIEDLCRQATQTGQSRCGGGENKAWARRGHHRSNICFPRRCICKEIAKGIKLIGLVESQTWHIAMHSITEVRRRRPNWFHTHEFIKPDYFKRLAYSNSIIITVFY